MNISIIHPSRHRPEQAHATAKAWLSTAVYRQNIQYILSIDKSENYANNIAYHRVPVDLVLTLDNRTAIEAINRAAMHATGDLLIVVSDDFSEPPMNWDNHLRHIMDGQSDFIVKTQDGLQPWIITLPIMDRVYYERFGYVYNPGYQHMFADTEMTHVADLLGRKITSRLNIPHHHYTTGKHARDSISVKNDATWAQGERLYLERLHQDFGLSGYPGMLQCDAGHLAWLRSKGVKVETV